MSIQTSIEFRNANDPRFLRAKNGSVEEIIEWEDFHGGPIKDRPGVRLECGEGEGYEETEDEYGGWIIDLSAIPKDTTHIVISRG